MNPNAITRVITLTPKPEKLEEALAEGAKFAKVIEDAEPGCLIFKNEAALKTHEESAHVQAYKVDSKKAEFLTAPPDVRVIIPAGGFNRV